MEIINKKANSKVSEFYVMYPGGSTYETQEQSGISHLIEHLVCCRVDPYARKWRDVGVKFRACTTSSAVFFYLYGLDQYVQQCKDELMSVLFAPIEWTDEEIEKERSIVEQERQTWMAMAQRHAVYNIMYTYANVILSIGHEQTIKSFTKADIHSFYRRMMRRPSKIIFLSDGEPLPLHHPMLDRLPEEDNDALCEVQHSASGNEPRLPLSTEDYKGDQVALCIHLINPISIEKMPYVLFWLQAFCEDLYAPFLKEIREKQKATYRVSYQRYVVGSYVHPFVTMLVDKTKVQDVTETIHHILNHASEYITESDFDKLMKRSLIFREMWQAENPKYVQEISGDSLYMDGVLEQITYDGFLAFHNEYFLWDSGLVGIYGM